jgi:SAM-dependent methyltransferase
MAHSHLNEMLDLDAEVLHEYHDTLIGWAASLMPDGPQIIDVGAGTGTGTLALARRLPGARVVAVDADEAMLEHLRHRAHAVGVTDRVRTVVADLDLPWPELGPADLAWASASLHHLADPNHAVAEVFAALRPGGVLLIAELESFPRFLPDGDGSALEERCHAVLARRRLEAGLHMGEDWGARLGKAGFVVEAERRFDIDLRPTAVPTALPTAVPTAVPTALPTALPSFSPVARTGRYAEVCLGRMRHGLDGAIDPADLATLDAIVAGVATRTDLVVRTSRTVWVARRPSPLDRGLGAA